ncbi:MAG: immunoglobulin domain-containing protein [Chitinivibrionales bacterium]|nr:immunoglobulin domain-containing protein [Chitinivibrionales bacterium]
MRQQHNPVWAGRIKSVHYCLASLIFFMPFIFFCTDPLEPETDKSSMVSISIKLPEPTSNGVGFKIGELFAITTTVKYPRYVDSVVVDFGEEGNGENLQLRTEIEQNVSTVEYLFHIKYQKQGLKKIKAFAKLRNSSKEQSDGKEVLVGSKPELANNKLITGTPAQLILGQPCTVSVALITPLEDAKFRWFKNYELLKEQITGKILIPKLAKEHEGIYLCLVNNDFGVDTSKPFTLTAALNPTPMITAHPQNQQTIVGKKVLFNCQAIPVEVSYQWYRNGLILDSAKKTDYAIEAATLQDNNVKFKCRVYNANGEAWSTEAVLTVYETEQPPKITKHPENVSVSVGEKAQFKVEANGTSLLYQWQKSGVDVAGANKPIFEIASVTEVDNNLKIRCKVSNSIGSDVSNEAMLTIKTIDPPQKPQITAEPKDLEVNEGAEAIFSITATGKELKYQWKRNGTEISGAVEPTYKFVAKKEDNGIKFRCAVSNTAGIAESKDAVLTVKSGDQPTKPQIVTEPKDVEVTEGTEAVFTVVATGKDLKFQWKKNGADIPGATETIYKYVAKKEDNGAKFRCVITNGAGTVESKEVLLRVTEKVEKPAITKHPENAEAFKGEQATFSVEASGTNLRYQWKRNGSDMSGDTATVLTIKSVTKEDNNITFSCVVKNSAGEAVSNSAKLTVKNRPPKLTVSNSISNGAIVPVKEEETLSFTVTAEDADVGDKLTLKSENLPQGATFAVNGNSGSFSYKPDYSVSKKSDEKQFSDVKFIVEDSDAEKATVAITIKVTNVNRKPQYSGTSATVQETQTGNIDIAATDPDDDQLTWKITGSPVNGTLSTTSGTVSGSTECTFTSKNLPQNKTENLQVSISDGTEEVSGSLTITINAQNEKPKITSVGSLSCQEDQTSGQLTINGEDPEGGKIYYGTVKSQPRLGSFNPGTGTYTPNPNANGQDNFSITIKDEQGLESDPATVQVTIQPVNDPPVMISANPGSIDVSESSKSVSLSGSDPDNESVSFTCDYDQSKVSVSVSGSNATVQRVDKTNAINTTLRFYASDGKVKSSTSKDVTCSAAKGNKKPAWVSIPDYRIMSPSEANGKILFNLNSYCTDDGPSNLTFTCSFPNTGSLIVQASASGNVGTSISKGMPEPGTYSMTFTAFDGEYSVTSGNFNLIIESGIANLLQQ